MRKIIWILLISMVFAAGCSKKYAKAPEVKEAESKQLLTESGSPEEKTEVVEDITDPEGKGREIGIHEGILPSAKEDEMFTADDVLFDYDKYTIRESSRPGLNAAAAYLRDKRQINIVIEGHCDERGTNEYNLALGEKRAKAVKNYFTSLGVTPSSITNMTYGEERPLCSDQNEDCWQRNRRAHIVVQ